MMTVQAISTEQSNITEENEGSEVKKNYHALIIHYVGDAVA